MQFILDVHCHTIASGHASGTLDEHIKRAKEAGLQLTATSEHGPAMPDSCPISHFGEILKLPKIINDITLLSGVEANIIDAAGNIDMPKDLLEALDFCIASIHPTLFLPGDAKANTNAVIGAMENPLINIIGHLGDHHVPIYPQDIVSAAKRTGTIIEINNKSLVPGNRRFDGGATIKEILALCKEYGASVIAGSDAHMAKDVGRVNHAKGFILAAHLDESLVMNTSVERFVKALKGKYYYGKSTGK